MIVLIIICVIFYIGWLLLNHPIVHNIPNHNYSVPPSQSRHLEQTFSHQRYYESTQPRTQYNSQSVSRIWKQYKDPTLTAAVYKNANTQNWSSKSLSDLRNERYKLVSLSKESTAYQKVLWLFKNTAQKQLKIHMIKRVENPYLFGCYILKREELVYKCGLRTKEINYFHGTKAKNVHSICSNNFDWRLHGDSRGNRFGKGVSFSPIANYSSHYCDNNTNCENVMFVARVLVADSIIGSKDMIIPPNGYDTAKKEDGHVVVKFCDSEFYPEYVIYYTGSAAKNIK